MYQSGMNSMGEQKNDVLRFATPYCYEVQMSLYLTDERSQNVVMVI